MAEQLVTLFSADIQKNLFENNSFVSYSKLDGGIDINAAFVNVPQSGTVPTVNKLGSSQAFPLTASQREDLSKSYPVDLYYTDPIHLLDVNELVVNYSKRQEIMSDTTSVLKDAIAQRLLTDWSADVLANGGFSITTGASRPAYDDGVMTGTRLKVTYSDIVALATKMTRAKIPQSGRVLVIGPDMFQDLLEIEEFISHDFNKGNSPTIDGSLGTVAGFNVFLRSTTLFCDQTGEIIPEDGIGHVATDSECALAYHPSFVRRAEGTVKIYVDSDNPLYLGSIMNASLRVGGVAGYNDSRGVLTLGQGT